MQELTVTEAKTQLNRLVREVDRNSSSLLIRNTRTGDVVVLLAAHHWQAELQNLLGETLKL
ncbi:hypothetical protein BSQ39_05385 [Loigolactobacillus backii]|uniref:type II toxin-antitoxin system Phd/YefM family antitoxin n=1 Tax=Loigolactobacillus backii TaxID=375175 RepID=UPI000C1CA03D|nr:type II toxin-antitoxin system Phd/YefM family antitoxin [Loigolactobacillus backii]PIO83045.1 hypothetical protein BSQ39_05385 [Loigolactobacillus backii]